MPQQHLVSALNTWRREQASSVQACLAATSFSGCNQTWVVCWLFWAEPTSVWVPERKASTKSDSNQLETHKWWRFEFPRHYSGTQRCPSDLMEICSLIRYRSTPTRLCRRRTLTRGWRRRKKSSPRTPDTSTLLVRAWSEREPWPLRCVKNMIKEIRC